MILLKEIKLLAFCLANSMLTTSVIAQEIPRYSPPPLTSWQIQLQGDLNTSYDVDVYDIDLFDSSTNLIQELHLSGKKVICYFSAGSYENWRDDAQQFKPSDLGNPLDDWPGERWLDIRSENVKGIMQNRLDLAKQKGCDGVDPDNMDGYTNNPGVSITADDQLNYNRYIAEQAHARGLAVGLKNALDQIPDLVDYYDFAVNEQCAQYQECDLLAPFINNGKAVFNIEYSEQYIDDKNSKSTLCANAASKQLSTLIMPLLLDDSFRNTCNSQQLPNDELVGTNDLNPVVSEGSKKTGGGPFSLKLLLVLLIILLTHQFFNRRKCVADKYLGDKNESK